MTETEVTLFKCISENNHKSLSMFLFSKGSSLNVVGIVESRGYSLLAFCAFKHHTHCFNAVYEHAKRFNLQNQTAAMRQETLRNWADCRTDEEFRALHFASYHGNLQIIKILVEEMKADINVQNCYGANVLHVSAQGDQPAPLFYFVKEHNMNLNLVDKKGSTPLHWACYSRSEFALSYILALEPDLEI